MTGTVVARLRRITGRGSQDRGLSLTELLVAMMIFALLLAMTVGFFTSASRANQLDHNLDTSNRSASTAMNEVTRMIRGAVTHPVSGQTTGDPAFSTAGQNTITFYTSVNLTGSTASMLKVAYSVSGTSLVEQVWQPTSASTPTTGFYFFPTNPTTTKTLATNVVLPANGGPNLFSYVDGTGATIALTGGSVATATVPTIAAVTVSIQVGANASSTQSTLLTDTVGLPNLNISRNPS